MLPLGSNWALDMVVNSIKLMNARTTVAVFDTKMIPPRQLCQQQILPECAKFVRPLLRCRGMETQDAPYPEKFRGAELGRLAKKLHSFHDSEIPPSASIY